MQLSRFGGATDPHGGSAESHPYGDLNMAEVAYAT